MAGSLPRTTTPTLPVPAGAGAAAPRLALAQLASAAAVRTPGVVSLRRSAHVTEEHGVRVGGVRVIAEGGGRYEVAVALVAAPVALHALATRVRERIRRAATVAGLADRLGSIAVAIVDVVEVASEQEPTR
ncbi:hypothetical protein [Conexibacter sp. CPCC 206217]|uniref:hypothetical protein n=1 Tax=Conexibacter sp. CPCC 206217 TaxID=3064574 RepID=UPI00271A5113|nr:hypothetical protein [Conexibacter sp. CPCC 206217]MDO8212182.1 hypothetical protein [Conexibacter sp. CPCC 206217]